MLQKNRRLRGAKARFLIGDGLDDREWLANLVRVTERELPAPKPKKPKAKKPRG